MHFFPISLEDVNYSMKKFGLENNVVISATSCLIIIMKYSYSIHIVQFIAYKITVQFYQKAECSLLPLVEDRQMIREVGGGRERENIFPVNMILTIKKHIKLHDTFLRDTKFTEYKYIQ